jgi:hypothetical protein
MARSALLVLGGLVLAGSADHPGERPYACRQLDRLERRCQFDGCSVPQLEKARDRCWRVLWGMLARPGAVIPPRSVQPGAQ